MARKGWLSLDDQVELLAQRGLVIKDPASCRTTLHRVGYYHLSGYGRFFQTDPSRGDNRFRAGTTFESIAELQTLDSQLRHLCLSALGAVELAVRTGFAYRFAEHVDGYEALLDPASYHSAGSASTTVDDLIGADLDRSKQPFIARHRNATDRTYRSLPVWVAVEALSFGTLSKAIEHCAASDVVTAMADDFQLPRTGFSSQLRSFVALRNACAHMSRLWNDVAKNPPLVPHNITGRAKKAVGQFSPQSYYQSFVALERFAAVADPRLGFLAKVDALMTPNPVFTTGLLKPTPYK